MRAVYLSIIKYVTSMKTKSIFLAAFLVTAVAAFGSDEPKKAGVAIVPIKGTEVFKVIYKSENAGKVRVNVYDADNDVVYTERFNNTNGFILPLNFSKLGFGEYTVELIDGSGKQIQRIVSLPAVVIGNIRVAKLDAAQDKFLVAVSGSGNEKITVRIFDGHNNLLHNEVKSIVGDFAQVYTVKNLRGALTFEVSDNNGFLKTVKF
jgi:hypothetical protein